MPAASTVPFSGRTFSARSDSSRRGADLLALLFRGRDPLQLQLPVRIEGQPGEDGPGQASVLDGALAQRLQRIGEHLHQGRIHPGPGNAGRRLLLLELVLEALGDHPLYLVLQFVFLSGVEDHAVGDYLRRRALVGPREPIQPGGAGHGTHGAAGQGLLDASPPGAPAYRTSSVMKPRRTVGGPRRIAVAGSPISFCSRRTASSFCRSASNNPAATNMPFVS